MTVTSIDETSYWLELLIGAGIVTEKRLKPLCQETEELTAILVTIVKNVKNKRNQ